MNIIIIGAGPGGYVAALYAAKRGLQVTLVEKAEVGGTCLNRGCIPTKTILHSAKLFRDAKNYESLGIDIAVRGVDYARINQRSAAVTSRLRSGVEFLLKKAGVKVVRGQAALMGGGQVRVESAEGVSVLSADKIILAVGAAPVELPIAPVDGDRIINSNHALALSELPKSLAIVGGGVIGCEFAQAFARLGAEVTVIEAMPRLLPEMDEDISRLLLKTLERDGVKVYLNARLKRTSIANEGVAAVFDTETGDVEVNAQKLLVAVGRKPNLHGLGLDAAGVAHEGGFVRVSDSMQTNVPGIYAIGDTTGGIQLAHVASYGGIIAVRHILGESAGMSGACIPMCVYTDPEIACAGLAAGAARLQGYECREGVFPLSANARAVIEGAEDGFAKMVLDSDGTILGAHLMGPNVTEMISLMGGLIGFQTAAPDMEEIVFAHPSVSEVIAEAVLAADRMALHIP